MQQRSAETRGRIFDSALRLFAARGYDAASVDDICSDAGISKGAFYHHFNSKHVLFIELMNGWLKTIDLGLDSLKQPSVPETFIKMTGILPLILRAADDRLPMFLEFWLQASRDKKVWKAMIKPYHHYMEYFTQLVDQGIQDGSLKPVDSQIAGQLILSMAVGLLLQGVLDPGAADWEKVARDSMEILMKGLSK